MKRIFIFLCFSFLSAHVWSQKDSLQIGDKYSEDQLYISITYNQLFSQPSQVKGSGFSYGLSSGFMRDISFNKEGTLALGLGVGYGYDSFNHGLKVSRVNNEVTFEVDNSLTSNKLSIHSLEFPLELRWRDSSVNKYKFWRIYAGLKVSYNFSNTFTFNNGTQDFNFRNVSRFNKWQYGLTMAAGFDAFTAHLYYGLTPILKDTSIGTSNIETKIIRIGLVFYLL